MLSDNFIHSVNIVPEIFIIFDGNCWESKELIIDEYPYNILENSAGLFTYLFSIALNKELIK